jgi:hypothetical protein
MKPFVRALTGSLVLTLAFAAYASAQATRTWVSGVGDDVNPCSRTAPCKTFAGAISKTAVGGEIDALDDGGFGTVTITKSITIDGGGHLASVLASGGINGINVNDSASGTPGTAKVILRNLTINGTGTTPGLNGVNITSGLWVSIENCYIFGFRSGTGRGVSLNAGGNATLVVTNSHIEDNIGAGVFVAAGKATISHTFLLRNDGAGLDVNGTSPSAMISDSTLSFNGRGLRTNGGAVVRITHLDIAFNTVFAWEILGGVIQTHVDNRIIGTGSGALTPVVF